MNGQDVAQTTTTTSTAPRACLVDGCTCKDARIVSTRRASYFASVARARGETADRVIAADPAWTLPTWSEPDLGPAAADTAATARSSAVFPIRFDTGA